MPEGMTFEDAAQALSAASQAPESGQTPAPPAPPAASQPASSEVEQGATPPAPATPEQQDSFTNIDPSSLPPELQAIYKNMQADYTRKLQTEVAPYRGIDLERAQQALQFVEALETDPEFVVNVHSQLSQALQAAGYSPAQADAIASAEVNAAGGDGDGLDDPDSATAQRLERVEQFMQEYQEQQAQMALAAELQRSEMAIRAANPDYSDTDIERLYEIAFAHGGDLNAAEQSYRAMRDSFLSSYIESKGDASGAPPVVTGTGHSEQPTQAPTSLEDAHKMAMARLLAEAAEQ